MKIEYVWRQIFKILTIHKPSLRSSSWFRKKIGIDLFSHFDIYWLQTNRQTHKHCWIYNQMNYIGMVVWNQEAVSKFLPPVLLKLNSQNEGVRKKVMELLVHINKRIKNNNNIQLPVESLLLQYQVIVIITGVYIFSKNNFSFVKFYFFP